MPTRRSYAGAAGVVSAGALAAVLLAGSSATAQSGEFTIEPSEPLPNSVFTVSGGGCADFIDGEGQPIPEGEDGIPRHVEAGVIDEFSPALENQFLPFLPDLDWLDLQGKLANSDGSWSIQLTLPEDVEPGQELFVAFACNLTNTTSFSRVSSFGVGVPPEPTPDPAPPPQAPPGAAAPSAPNAPATPAAPAPPGAAAPSAPNAPATPAAPAPAEDAPDAPTTPPAAPAIPVESEPSFTG